jgi:hypothetical protein
MRQRKARGARGLGAQAARDRHRRSAGERRRAGEGAGMIMADRPRRSRQKRKPLPEIETAIEAHRQLFRGSWRGLFSMIMSIGNLHNEERTLLMDAANNALGETFDYLGFLAPLPGLKHKLKRMSAARAGNRAKAIRWHDKAEKLAAALWEERADFRGNASSTAAAIHEDLAKFCSEVGVKAPVAGTVAKHIARLS